MIAGDGSSEEPAPAARETPRLVPWGLQLSIDKLPSGRSVATNVITREVYELPGTEDWSVEIDDFGSATLFSYDEVADAPLIIDADTLFQKAVFADAGRNLFTADLRIDSYFVVGHCLEDLLKVYLVFLTQVYVQTIVSFH